MAKLLCKCGCYSIRGSHEKYAIQFGTLSISFLDNKFMAVDYTKVFTVIGSIVDKVNDYFTYIDVFTNDQADLEDVLSNQVLVRLEGTLPEDYQDFKDNVSDWIGVLIDRSTTVLTDEQLIGDNFAFGTNPSLTIVWPALLHDMVENDINVESSVSTIGSINYDTANAQVGVIETGTLLDGFNPPMQGAQAIIEYVGLETQMTPDDETITFTCVSDSEHSATRGGETFQITGTNAGSDPYSPGGENIGILGNIQVADNQASRYVTNSSFDSWTGVEADGWTTVITAGGTTDQAIVESENTVTGSGSSLRTIPSGNKGFVTYQTVNPNIFDRNRAYFLSCWAQKDTDILGDQSLILSITSISGFFKNVTVNPTTTAWEHFSGQFIIPAELTDDLYVEIIGTLVDTNDSVRVDQVVITPCTYIAGVAVALFGGPEKWREGDFIEVPLSNTNDGLFQTFARKAYKVQLPTDDTPTISDDLVI